ncbi:MAG: Hsp20/alpha crystallin family protein [Candidatus Eremiobacteraeota bacterium]|nr:Hsp20/alpha crystallin family protein [Candidatus Eremiobacteraeota bacterium]
MRSRAGFEPNADVFLDEEGGRVIVNVELAGADPESLRIDVDERHLFIIGRRGDAPRLHCGSFLQKEIAYGDFVKQLHLPVAVRYEDVEAAYADGILTVYLPVSATDYIPTTRTEIRMIVKRTLA